MESAPKVLSGSETRWRRREDARLVAGAGRFVSHLNQPEQLHAAFVRAAQASASFTLPAFSQAGLQTFTHHDFPNANLPQPNPLFPPDRAYEMPVFPERVCAYVGQPLALIIGPSADAAQQAADEISAGIVYTPVPLTSTQAPMFSVNFSAGEISSADNDCTVRIEHAQPRVQAFAMEPRASVAARSGDALTLWTGTQAVSRAQKMLADVLNVPSAQIRVIAPDVGGAFGAKASLYPEDFALALAAWRCGTPLKWVATRSEEFLSATHGRGSHLNGTLTVSKDGAFKALTATLTFPLGAWLPFSAAIPLRNAARILPGPYRVPAIDVKGEAHTSPHAAVNIYRGAGRPEAALVMERLIDAAAGVLGIDPVELRRKNLVPASAMPYRTPTGETFDSGDYAALLDDACAAFDYPAARAHQAARRTQGERVGIGIALYVEPCGQGWESAKVTLHADGCVDVASGAPAQGQGHETTFAKIAADVLNVPSAQIAVIFGDTNTAPEGIGALASRSIAIGGSAITRACAAALKLKDAGAPFPIVVNEKYTAPMEAWSAGCVIAQLSVDIETGAPKIERIVWCDDAGNVISPDLAHGQMIGGLAQGLGQAMCERIRYDDAGQLLSGSLMDYAVPRADDMPPVQIIARKGATTANALGAKGVGEAGCIGVPAALLNAACDALHDCETSALSFPLTSETLWRTLHTRSIKTSR